MSKLGKKPISIPKDTKVKVENGKLIMTGPKGSKELSINDKIFTATVSDDKILSLKQKTKNVRNLNSKEPAGFFQILRNVVVSAFAAVKRHRKNGEKRTTKQIKTTNANKTKNGKNETQQKLI